MFVLLTLLIASLSAFDASTLNDYFDLSIEHGGNFHDSSVKEVRRGCICGFTSFKCCEPKGQFAG